MMDANGTTEFMWACSRGDHVLVKHMLKHEDVYLNHEDEFGNTALSLAVKHGHIKIVKLLLKFQEEYCSLESICSSKHTAFSLAVKHGQFEIVKMLIKDDVSILFLEVNNDSFETLLNCDAFDMNIRDDEGWTPIMWAGHGYGETDHLKQLLEKDGLNIQDDYQLLMYFYDDEIKNCQLPDDYYVEFHRNLKLFQTRKQQETFLTSEYIQALRLPLMCKDLSGEIASYFSWDDVSPRKRAPANVLRENEHLMAKYNRCLFGLEGGGAFESSRFH